jgi:hypothetical protein
MDPIMANESQPLWVKPPSLEVNLVGREPSKNWDFHGLGMKVYGQVATLRAWISSSAYKKSRDHLKVSHTISSPTAPRIGDPDEHHISPQSSCHFFFLRLLRICRWTWCEADAVESWRKALKPILVKGLLPQWIPNAAGAVHTTSGRPNHSDVHFLCFAILTRSFQTWDTLELSTCTQRQQFHWWSF